MNLKITILIFFSSLFYFNSIAQIESANNTCCCKNTIEQLSEGWKKDALSSVDGFRFSNYKKLLNCKIDSVTTEFLLKKLGEPTSRGFSKIEVSFLYYFFDRNIISKKGLEDIIGIIFTFDRNKNRLLSKDLIRYDF